MQIIYKDRPERIWADFKNADGVSEQPSGTVTVTIQFQTGSVKVQDAVATYSEDGKYFYILDAAGYAFGYYGAFWRLNQSGIDITQDVPNVFKVENRAESIVKGVMTERVRSMLFMHTDSSGFQNKFERDREILDYLQESLNWWNSYPPALTFHSFIDLPTPYYSIVEEGAVIKALEALGIFEAGKHFIYNDNGISLTRDRSAKYQAIWNSLLSNYVQHLKSMRTKYALDNVTMKGQFSSTTGFPRSLSRALRGVQKFA